MAATRKSYKQYLDKAKQELCTCITLFLFISLPSTARLPVKMPNFTFFEGRKQAVTKFILFINFDMVDS